MYQVIHEILKNPNDKTQVNFVFANIEERDILLRKELDELAKKHPNLKVHYVLEKAPKDWKGSIGYVTEDVIKKHIPAPSGDSIVFVWFVSKFVYAKKKKKNHRAPFEALSMLF